MSTSITGRGRRGLRILGVELDDLGFDEALDRLGEILEGDATHVLHFVNAHTLNCACEDPSFRAVLNDADLVFGDGTGVRWAARMAGRRVRANLNGTDLIPALLDAMADRGLRYYLLGATEEVVGRAAAYCLGRFDGWELVGRHHGYVHDEAPGPLLEEIDRARPDLLLVGMGNPLQEQWIHRHRERLRVPLVAGVGGLFTYWSGSLDRAPPWMRRLGVEWLWIMLRQPAKMRRYLLGNPLYLARVAWDLAVPAAHG